MEHKYHQSANDWVMCKCGKIFSGKDNYEKFNNLDKHIEEQ